MHINHELLFGKTPFLAPMAGYTDLPFRLLCRECGCSAAYTEMISAKGLVYDNKSTRKYLNTCAQDSPLVVQLFGAEPHFLYKAVKILAKQGFKYFDLNAGCSVKKVTKTGSGAALLKNPQNLQNCLQAMLDATGEKKVGVKIRSGWTVSQPNYLEVGQKAQEIGAAWVTLHPRSATKGYAGSAEWTQLKELGQYLSVPLIGSGDLLNANQGIRCIQQTGISNVMFARGALKDPLIFRKFLLASSDYRVNRTNNKSWTGTDLDGIKDSCLSEVDSESNEARIVQEKIFLIKRHINLACQYEDEKRAFLKMRTLIPRYLNSFYQVGEIRKRVIQTASWKELLDIVDNLGKWLREQEYEFGNGTS